MKATLIAVWLLAFSTTANAQTPSAERGAHADLPGVRLWYTDTGGTGEAVVFLHARTGSSRVWEYQIPVFVARGYRVIAYDRRGFGRTVIDPAGAQPGTGADDLLALLNHLKIDRVHLVGTADGGFVAFDFALSFPQRLRSLVVANSFGGVQDEDYLELLRRLRPTPQFNALPPDFRELEPDLSRSKSPGHAALDRSGARQSSRGHGAGGADDAQQGHLLVARRHQGSDAAAHRRRGFVLAAGGAADVFSADQELGIGGRARGGPFGVLGAAGDLQPDRAHVHAEALSD